jgi:hypothetical protein
MALYQELTLYILLWMKKSKSNNGNELTGTTIYNNKAWVPHYDGRVTGLDDLFRFPAELRFYFCLALLSEALRYKPKGRGFDSRWSRWNFSLT